MTLSAAHHRRVRIDDRPCSLQGIVAPAHPSAETKGVESLLRQLDEDHGRQAHSALSLDAPNASRIGVVIYCVKLYRARVTASSLRVDPHFPSFQGKTCPSASVRPQFLLLREEFVQGTRLLSLQDSLLIHS